MNTEAIETPRADLIARIGALTLRRTTACVRCVVPTVDPASGDGAGRLSVGDRVELTLDFGAA